MRYVEDRQGYEAELFVDTDRVVRDTADEIYSDYSYKQLKDIQRSGKILALVKKYNSSLGRKEAEIAFEAALTWAKEDNVGARYESITEKYVPNFSKILNYVGSRNEGIAYIIYYTLENINAGMAPQEAFFEACENENFYGDRPDVVEGRKKAKLALEYLYEISVTHIF